MKAAPNTLPVVVVCGRPNVGKSSLFNVLLRKRIAIVHEEAGVTRDRVAVPAVLGGKPVLMVDTGGLAVLAKQKAGVDFMDEQIRAQLLAAVEDADLLVLVTDVMEGITNQDREVSNFLHTLGKPMLVVPNKCDNPDLADKAGLFSKLGGKVTLPVSCMHKTGLADLEEEIARRVHSRDGEVGGLAAPDLVIALAGRPNVGKSSIVNRMLGENRVIVSNIAGTTRDAVDVPFLFEDSQGNEARGLLVDTAGVKRRARIDNLVEMFSMERTDTAIKRADVVLLTLDCSLGVSMHEKKIAAMIKDAGRPCVILANKCDLLPKKEQRDEFMATLKREMPFLSHAPVIMCSAVDGFSFKKILPEALSVRDQSHVKVPTGILNSVLQDMCQRHPPPSTGKGFFKIYYGTMASNPPAHFILFCNKKDYCQPAYSSFVEKTLRKAFGLTGVPMVIEYRERTHVQDKYRAQGVIPAPIKAKLAAKRAVDGRTNKRRAGG